MTILTEYPETTRQEWETPDSLFLPLHRRYKFTLDVAADDLTFKCPRYFTRAEDALQQTWVGSCWLNPPYGDSSMVLLEWVVKAYNESRKPDCTVAMLLPVRSNTSWWHDYVMRAGEILFLRGRPKFGEARHGLPQPLAVAWFSSLSTVCRYYSFVLRTGEIG